MMEEVLEKKVKDLTERQAFLSLFYTLVNKNDYYIPIRNYANYNKISIEEVVEDITNYYDDYNFANPYKFLDNIAEYIEEHINTKLTISEILDCVPEYAWD